MKLKDYIIIGLITLAVFFFFDTDTNTVYKNTVTTDTIVKTVTRPQVHDTIYLTKYKERVLTRYKLDSTLVDSISILNAYIEAMTIREYKQTHNDSILSISVFSKVQGELISNRIEYVLKPRNIKVIETYTTEKKYPKYALYYGGGLKTATDLQNPSLNVNFGFQNKKGNIIEFEINTNSQISIGFKKRFLVKY